MAWGMPLSKSLGGKKLEKRNDSPGRNLPLQRAKASANHKRSLATGRGEIRARKTAVEKCPVHGSGEGVRGAVSGVLDGDVIV